MSEKLQKILARYGHGSRREIETFIKQGRVSIDSNIATIGDRVEIKNTTKIMVGDRMISIKLMDSAPCRVLAYYKPEGELCTYHDPEGRPTVFDRLPRLNNARWVSIGRLDLNTSGLLLFTTDGELANRLMHPRYEIEREYAVRIFGTVNKKKLRQLTCGIRLERGFAAFRSLKFQGGEGMNQWYKVTLAEGRNREIRLLWRAVGILVSRLIRVRYGSVTLPKWLPRGRWIELPLDNINYLREKVQLPLESMNNISIKHNHRYLK